jgi:glycosyltransferase involved in cell wall biosynthesis
MGGYKMKNKKRKIVVVLIAYNAGSTLPKFYNDLRKYYKGSIILVDDKSKDDTFAVAKKLKIKSYRNPKNLGYGGNLKRALYLSLKSGADIIIDIHPDGEYKPSAIPLAIEKIEQGAEFILGNRFTKLYKPLEGGMFFWKLLPLVSLNLICKIILRSHLNDFHQGFRVYTREMLDKINYEKNSNKYIFSFEIIAQSFFNNIIVEQVPVETNYTGQKRGATLKNSIVYTIATYKLLVLYLLSKNGFKNVLFEKPSKSLKLRLKDLDKFYESF